MTTDKKTVVRLTSIAKAKGVRHVVISPGSRNAPLIIAFGEDESFVCKNIPDERVAAFYALGMAMGLGEPVIICCTSGSAVLNYAPAIAEAYYQKIPLIVLTADRPPAWIDQNAGQTMRQRNVYENFVTKSFELLLDSKRHDDIWYNDRMINEAFDLSLIPRKGPVHINFPFEEPLYNQQSADQEDVLARVIQSYCPSRLFNADQKALFKALWDEADKVLIVVGQARYNPKLDTLLGQLLAMQKVVVLTEATSNIKCDSTSSSMDRLIAPITPEDFNRLAPDILISMGDAIVSKRIRGFLNKMRPKNHWHIDPTDSFIDTYQSLTANVLALPEEFLDQIDFVDSPSAYSEVWQEFETKTVLAHNYFLESVEWSDLRVFDLVHRYLPNNSHLHLANSTAVRYIQLFDQRSDVFYYGNRGVSGIDGCTSTAMGFASTTNDIVTVITGDIGFLYDSNAFFHHHVPENFRVLLINNAGGNIFRYIPGPTQTRQLEEHFEATHNFTAEGIAKTYGIEYAQVEDEKALIDQLERMFDPRLSAAMIVEVITPRERNAAILKEYFSFLANPKMRANQP